MQNQDNHNNHNSNDNDNINSPLLLSLSSSLSSSNQNNNYRSIALLSFGGNGNGNTNCNDNNVSKDYDNNDTKLASLIRNNNHSVNDEEQQHEQGQGQGQEKLQKQEPTLSSFSTTSHSSTRIKKQHLIRNISSLSTTSVRDLLNNSSREFRGLFCISTQRYDGTATADDINDDNNEINNDIDSDIDYDYDYNDNDNGTASITNEISNLIKNIVGCGVLSLPSGIASFANNQSAMIPSIGVITITGAIFGYYFHLLGRICNYTSASTFREAWERTLLKNNNNHHHHGGRGGVFIVILTNLLKPAMGNLSLSIILTDTLHSLFQTAGFDYVTRMMALFVCTMFGILPLCLIKNLTVLAPFSIIGLIAMTVTSISMGIRYFDGSYDLDMNGKFIDDLPEYLKPSFGSKGARYALCSPNLLILVCMLFEAYVAHYNAPRFYVELKDNTVRRFGIVSSMSFFISSVFYALIASFGFLTFGENANGYILNNYATNDAIATISRISVFISVLLTYPIVFMGFRDGILDLFKIPTGNQTSGNLNAISVVLLLIITAFASCISDLGVVNAVGGGILGTMIVFIFPTLMFASTVIDQHNEASFSKWVEVGFAFVLMILGIAMGLIGVLNALSHK